MVSRVQLPDHPVGQAERARCSSLLCAKQREGCSREVQPHRKASAAKGRNFS